MTATAPDPRALEALFSFWAEAGVDVCYADSPVDRTLPPPRPAAPKLNLIVSAPQPGLQSGPDPVMALAEARQRAAEATDLESLKAAIEAFRGCPLRDLGARQVVFGRGNPKGRILAIGEAPGADEDLQGLPFVGRSGQLLDRMLRAAGLFDDVFITNTVYWRPPGNRQPTPAEQLVLSPFVEKTIRLIQPKAILLIGGIAAKGLLGKEDGILKLRGQWFDWTGDTPGPTIKALPTLHPAFLLRQSASKKLAWEDLLKLSETLIDL
ncbi:MAG: uracil-DNA glycosylase family protein [Asticcacaulis sp.]